MAQLVYDYLEPAELTDLSREIQADTDRPEDFNYILQQVYLPSSFNHDIDFRITAGQSGVPASAKFRTFDAENPVGYRPGFTEIRGSLLPLGIRELLTEFERLKLRKAGAGAFEAELAAAAVTATMSVIVRIELAVVQTLLTGKTTITNERGVTQEADWGRDTGLTVTTLNSWANSSTGKPLTDIRNWQELVDTDVDIIMSKRTLALLAQNEEFRKLGGTLTGVPSFLSNGQVQSVLTGYGLPNIVAYDAKYLDDSGVEQRILPTNKILMVPRSGLAGRTIWGVTEEAMDPKYGIQEAAWPGIVTAHYENEHPKQSWVNASAMAFPVLANPKRTLAATVVL